jgi:hypothetical protein
MENHCLRSRLISKTSFLPSLSSSKFDGAFGDRRAKHFFRAVVILVGRIKSSMVSNKARNQRTSLIEAVD